MKILIFNMGYFPGKKYGGPPVSIDNLCSLLSNQSEISFYIITSNHDLGEKTSYSQIVDGWNERGNCSVLYLSDKDSQSYKTIKNLVKQLSPDIIYLQSIFHVYTPLALLLAKQLKINVLLAPRGELCKGALKKKFKKIPYLCALRTLGLFKNIKFQSTSDEETVEIARWTKTSRDNIYKLINVPSVPQMINERIDKSIGRANLIFLSRIVAKKNLLFAVEALGNVNGEICFDIYGPIEDKNYWALCLKKATELPANIKVKYCGDLSHDEVLETLNKYHAFLFPTKSENYGHVIVESLMAATPVIVSDQTPWLDLQYVNAGWALPLTLQFFSNAIQDIIDMPDNKYNKMRHDARRYIEDKINLNEIKNTYLNVFRTLCQK